MVTFLKKFLFGPEIWNILKICRRWWWGGGGNIRRACVIVRIFLVFYISDRIYQNGVLHLKNFHFSLSIFKNGVKTLFCMIAKVNSSKICRCWTSWPLGSNNNFFIKHRHRRNVTSHHSLSLLWQFQLLKLPWLVNFHH